MGLRLRCILFLFGLREAENEIWFPCFPKLSVTLYQTARCGPRNRPPLTGLGRVAPPSWEETRLNGPPVGEQGGLSVLVGRLNVGGFPQVPEGTQGGAEFHLEVVEFASLAGEIY